MTFHRPRAVERSDEHFLRGVPDHKCLNCGARLRRKKGIRADTLVEV